MARSIWSGAISFGLVNVPVKLYSAVSRKTVRFNQLNAETGNRIQQKRVDPETGEEVPYDQIVKGFELTKDRYVVITPDELDALDPERTRTIQIEDFVDLAGDRPDLLRPPVLPRARQGRGEGLRAAAQRHGGVGQGRDRARGHPLQGGARRHPPGRRAADDGDDDLPRRGRARTTTSTICRTPRTSRSPTARSRWPSSSSTRSRASSSPRSTATSTATRCST